MKKYRLSVILPVFNEENNLRSLNEKIFSVLDSTEMEFEIVYVDDGSIDKSSKILEELAHLDKRIKIIRLAKNYGQTLAMQAGIDYSQGDILIFMDADFQNDPADIPKLLIKIKEGYDVVSGWRRNRHDALFSRKLPSYIANKLISFLTGVYLNDYGCTLKAYKRDIIKNIRLYGQMHRFIPLYAAMRGAAIAEIEVSHHKRIHNRSKYSMMRVFNVILDLITVRFLEEYSTKPFYLFGGIGLALAFIGILIGISIIVRRIIFAGIWVSPLLFIMFMFIIAGVQSILIGLLSEVLIRIYHRSSPEPAYLIKKIIKSKDTDEKDIKCAV